MDHALPEVWADLRTVASNCWLLDWLRVLTGRLRLYAQPCALFTIDLTFGPADGAMPYFQATTPVLTALGGF